MQGDIYFPKTAMRTCIYAHVRIYSVPVVSFEGRKMARTQALAGGEIGINGHHYKGGQFLPSTQAEPGRWKVGGKWVMTGRRLVAPGEFALQPTPFSVALFQLAGVGYATTLDEHGRLVLNPGANGDGVRDYDGNQITRDTEVRPGIKGILGKDATTIGAIVDAWNDGMRWFEVTPDAETKTA